MYILEHVRIHPLDSFPGRCQDTNRNGPPFHQPRHGQVTRSTHGQIQGAVGGQPMDVARMQGVGVGTHIPLVKRFGFKHGGEASEVWSKMDLLLISMESFNLNTLSLRFGDTKWEKSIEHQFFWPHLTALNVVSICSLCTLRMYTASVEGVGWCCGQCLATKGANVMPNFWEEMLNCFHITSSLRFVTICRTFDKHDGYSKVRCYSVLSLLGTTSAMNDRKSWLPNASNQHSQTKTFENIGQVCHDIA